MGAIPRGLSGRQAAPQAQAGSRRDTVIEKQTRGNAAARPSLPLHTPKERTRHSSSKSVFVLPQR